MIKCPGCGATLPGGSANCQFCGHQLVATAAKSGRSPSRLAADNMSGTPRWVWPTYYAIAGWWVLGSAINILIELGRKGGPSTLTMMIECVTALVGLGLILRVEAARGIVNVICFLNILFGVLGLVALVFTPFIGGIFGAILLVFQLIKITFAGLMIFLIGETDGGSPNF